MYLLWLFLLASAGAEVVPDPRVVEPPLRYDMPPPPETARMSTRNVFENYIRMPLDHFNPQNSDTFLMRYMFNEQFFAGTGSPVFILVGGEWDIAAGWLLAGNMFEMARENGGYQVYTEHRYYGETVPYTNFTTENLRFLNVDQALADLAYFIQNMKQAPQFADSKFILYGGSYAANMVLWFKQRYPHLVEGVVASSGPIKGQVDFTGYLEVVHDAFYAEGGEQCISTIRQGILDTVEAVKTEEGRRELEQAYRLCAPLLDYDDVYELGYFSGLISWRLSGSVQTARPGDLLAICNNFAGNIYGTTPMQKIGGYIAQTAGLQTCWAMEYSLLINTYSNPRSNSRAWYYQTCTEYGFYQTAPTSGTVFDPLIWLSVDFYVDICKKAFTEKFDEEFVYDAVERVNLMFGGLEPNVNNTINIHGDYDPWHALGVYEHDLKENSPTITVPRASHCFDMQGWLTTDTIRMTQTKQEVRRIVASWLD
ncbi:putative serine protease K12H4.7 [Cydia strobilella]|uniref:putative serine protease K12H4.7 n=1 Tax=Cydia strobilella TaxID=1100964 RepID=UPI0030049759